MNFQDGTCINLEELCSGSCFVKETKFLLKCSQASPWKPPWQLHFTFLLLLAPSLHWITLLMTLELESSFSTSSLWDPELIVISLSPSSEGTALLVINIKNQNKTKKQDQKKKPQTNKKPPNSNKVISCFCFKYTIHYMILTIMVYILRSSSENRFGWWERKTKIKILLSLPFFFFLGSTSVLHSQLLCLSLSQGSL